MFLYLTDVNWRNISCPYGDALYEEDEPITCDTEPHKTIRKASKPAGDKSSVRVHTPCPSTYHCRRVPTLGIGVCCPIQQSTTKSK